MIGPILGQGYVGIGINRVVVHSQVGSIASITGIGNGDGIFTSTVVSEAGIGPISGQSTVQGTGINGCSFDALGTLDPTNGTIGQITGQGGPAGGNGISATLFQATGNIAGISGTANVNGGNAIDAINTYATSYGQVDATVLGGQLAAASWVQRSKPGATTLPVDLPFKSTVSPRTSGPRRPGHHRNDGRRQGRLLALSATRSTQPPYPRAYSPFLRATSIAFMPSR